MWGLNFKQITPGTGEKPALLAAAAFSRRSEAEAIGIMDEEMEVW